MSAEKMAVDEIIFFGKLCAERGLLVGYNGNISVLVDKFLYITSSGTVKGLLDEDDFSCINIDSDEILKGQPSSELAMHKAIYQATPKNTFAVIHSHPSNLLALSLKKGIKSMFELPLFECMYYQNKIGFVAALDPGSKVLAEKVGESAKRYQAIWLENHGLVCFGKDLRQAFALTEEYEAQAKIALKA